MEKQTKRTLKILSFGAVGTVLSFFTFYFFGEFLVNEELVTFILFSAFTWLLLAFVVLELLFFERGKGMLVLLIVQGFVPLLALLPFISPPLYFVVLGAGIFTLFLVIGVVSAAKEIENSLKIKPFLTGFRALSKVTTGFIILILAVTFVYFIQMENLTEDKMEAIFDNIFHVTDPILDLFLPGVSFSMSVEEVVSEIEERRALEEQRQLIRGELGPDEVDESQTSEERIEAAIDRFEEISGNYLGVVDETMPIGSVVFRALDNWTSGLSNVARGILGASIMVPLFFLLKLVLFFLYVPIQITSFVMYKILILSGFAYIIYEQKSKEVIRLAEPSSDGSQEGALGSSNNNLIR